jgi:hypothetical protein
MAVDDREVSITVNYVITNRVSCTVAILCQPSRLFLHLTGRKLPQLSRILPALPGGEKKDLLLPKQLLAYISPLLSLLYFYPVDIVRCG